MTKIGSDQWKNSENKVIRYEEEYRRLHQVILNGGDRFIINLDNESEDEEDFLENVDLE